MANINHTIDTAGMAQKTGTTCWLACYKMLLKAGSKPHDEATIRAKLKTFSISYDDAYANGLDGKDWHTASIALGFAPMVPAVYKSNSGFLDTLIGKTSGQKAFLALLEKGPLWIGKFVSAGNSHAVIARGYDESDNKVVWVNPQSASGTPTEMRSMLDLFIGTICAPLGGVQILATQVLKGAGST